MKKSITLSLTALFTVVLTSCGGFGTASGGYDMKKGIIGIEGTDAKDYLVGIALKENKFDPATVEFEEISVMAKMKNETDWENYYFSFSAVNPKDDKRVDQYLCHSESGWVVNEIVFSDVMSGNVASTREDIEHMLFKLSDVEPFLDKMPEYLKTASEKSEYGDNGYVSSWSIERDSDGTLELYIRVSYKKDNTTGKSFRVDTNGNFNK